MTPDTRETYRHRVLKVQLFIQEHLSEDLSLDRLAKIAHFSPYHFHRVFKAFVGEGVAEYVRRLRLEAAAMSLRFTARTVLVVALEAGYETHEAFTRAFRQRFGVSPSEYRDGAAPCPTPEEVRPMAIDPAELSVRVVTRPPTRVAFVRHVGPYMNVGSVFEKFMQWCGQKGQFGPGVQVLGVCHDDPEVTDQDKLRYDCAITVGESFRPEGEVGVQTLEGGEYATAVVKGPYSKLGPAWRWLYGVWLPASGREPRNAPPFEVYVGNPDHTKPEDLLTELWVPLASR